MQWSSAAARRARRPKSGSRARTCRISERMSAFSRSTHAGFVAAVAKLRSVWSNVALPAQRQQGRGPYVHTLLDAADGALVADDADGNVSRPERPLRARAARMASGGGHTFPVMGYDGAIDDERFLCLNIRYECPATRGCARWRGVRPGESVTSPVSHCVSSWIPGQDGTTERPSTCDRVRPCSRRSGEARGSSWNERHRTLSVNLHTSTANDSDQDFDQE